MWHVIEMGIRMPLNSVAGRSVTGRKAYWIWRYIYRSLLWDSYDRYDEKGQCNKTATGWMLFFWEIMLYQVFSISLWGLAIARSASVMTILNCRNHALPLCHPPRPLHMCIKHEERCLEKSQ